MDGWGFVVSAFVVLWTEDRSLRMLCRCSPEISSSPWLKGGFWLLIEITWSDTLAQWFTICGSGLLWGYISDISCISDIHITIHNSNKFIVMK